MKIGDTADAEVYALNSVGKGVARGADGMTLFIEGALPGERVTCRAASVKKNYAECKTTRILTRSPVRAEPPCPRFGGECGGCSLMHMTYAAQTEFKRKKVAENIERIGKIERFEVLPVVASRKVLRYRNKLSIPVRNADGELKAGMFARNSREISPFADCALQPSAVSAAAGITTGFLRDNGVTAYDERAGRGLARRITARAYGDFIALALVLNGDALPRAPKLVAALSKEFSNNFAAYVRGAGGEYAFIGGDAERTAEFMGLKFAPRPAAFMQVNDCVAEKLYGHVLETIDGERKDAKFARVIDAYCGAGLLTCLLSRRCEKVTGIEISPEAVADAAGTAAANGIRNAEFLRADCARALPNVLKNAPADTALVLDPPRNGCDAAALDAILTAPPRTVVYVSCDPATLSRDLFRLKSAYEIVSILPFDMFPQTEHVETVVTLRRR